MTLLAVALAAVGAFLIGYGAGRRDARKSYSRVLQESAKRLAVEQKK